MEKQFEIKQFKDEGCLFAIVGEPANSISVLKDIQDKYNISEDDMNEISFRHGIIWASQLSK